mgnify:FL=1
MVAIRNFLLFSLLLPAASANACGWWGDGEMNRDQKRDFGAAAHSYTPNMARLPDHRGYGIAVPDPGRAAPYMTMTHGRPISRIKDLVPFGFDAVIDLGPPPHALDDHRQETEAAGMAYFNIPIKDYMPTPEQTALFGDVIVSFSAKPSLVYAPTPALLGGMWAAYRISMGGSLDYSIAEGRTLGMTPDQEKQMRDAGDIK